MSWHYMPFRKEEKYHSTLRSMGFVRSIGFQHEGMERYVADDALALVYSNGIVEILSQHKSVIEKMRSELPDGLILAEPIRLL